MKIVVIFLTVHLSKANLEEKVSLNWLFSPSFELREKLKCMEHNVKYKTTIRTTPCNHKNTVKLLPADST